MTVRHLLTMSSGLATDDAWADRHLDLHDDELDAIVADGVTFAWMPGVTFEYSNLGYGVLGRVVRNITGSHAPATRDRPSPRTARDDAHVMDRRRTTR